MSRSILEWWPANVYHLSRRGHRVDAYPRPRNRPVLSPPCRRPFPSRPTSPDRFTSSRTSSAKLPRSVDWAVVTRCLRPGTRSPRSCSSGPVSVCRHPPDITVPLVVVAVVFVALPGGDWLLNLVVDSYQRLFRPPHDPEGFTPAYLVMSSKLWLDVAIVMAILWLHDIAPTAIGLTPPSWWLTTLSVVGGGCLGWGMGFVYGQPTLTAAAVSGHQGGRRPRRVPRTGDRTHSWVPCLQGWAFYFVIAIAG